MSTYETCALPSKGVQDAATELRIMPFVLVRIAGLAATHGVELPGREVSEIAARLRSVVEQLHVLAINLVSALFDAVAQPSATAYRAGLLRAKRQVFNGVELLASAELLAWLEQKLPDVLALCQAYQQVFRTRAELQARLESSCAAQQETTRAILQDALAQPAFNRALGLAAPRLLAQLQLPLQAHPRKRRKQLERTLMAFMLRAGMKVSPFSSFASTCQANLDPICELGHLHAHGQRLQGTSRLSRSVVVALREQLAESSLAESHKVEFCLNPSLRFLQDENAFLRSLRAHGRDYQVRRGMLWSEESLLNARLAPSLCALLQGLPACFGREDFLRRLRQIEREPQKAERLLKQLLRKDILRLLPQWQAQDDAPALLLADAMQEHPQMTELVGQLRQLDNRARTFADTPTSLRPALLNEIEEGIAELHTRLGNRHPPRLASSVYEDVRNSGLTLSFGTRFAEQTLRRIADVVGRYATISAEYLWLRECFIERFAEGGCCTDVEGFLRDVWPAYLALGQNILNGNVPRPVLGRVAPAALRLPLTVYFQLVTPDLDEALNGKPLVVINGAYHRAAWQLARGAISNDTHQDPYETQLRDWIVDVHRPIAPATVTVSGESSNLQAQPRLCERQLCLDEQPMQDSDLLLRDMQLIHNADTGLLELIGPDHQPLALQYLGGASPLPAWGIKYLLTMLVEPVQIGRPGAEMVSAGHLDADFRHQPRLEDDGCVLLRETWWLRSRMLLECLEGLSSSARVAALLRLCAEHGIPEDVFVNGQFDDFFGWKSFAAAKTRKPFWCRLSNIACMDYLLGLARDTDWLVLREALPAPQDSWLKIDDKPYVTEMHTEMVLVGGHMANGWIK